VVHINAGHLTHFPGGYQYYLDKTQAESARAALTSPGKDVFHRTLNSSQKEKWDAVERVPTVSRRDQKRVEAEQRQSRSRERRAQQQIVDELEKQIQQLELRQNELIMELEKPETYEQPARAMQINRELVDVQEQLARVNPEWEEQATKLAG